MDLSFHNSPNVQSKKVNGTASEIFAGPRAFVVVLQIKYIRVFQNVAGSKMEVSRVPFPTAPSAHHSIDFLFWKYITSTIRSQHVRFGSPDALSQALDGLGAARLSGALGCRQ